MLHGAKLPTHSSGPRSPASIDSFRRLQSRARVCTMKTVTKLTSARWHTCAISDSAAKKRERINKLTQLAEKINVEAEQEEGENESRRKSKAARA
jgi:hypothetical protein